MAEQHSANFKFGQWLSTPPPGEEVVITGMSGRFPKSSNVKEFKDNLYNKEDMISDPDKRWTVKHREIPTKGGLIPDIGQFDPGFFGIHYRQALNMDPSVRTFLEVALEAIMDAGVNPSELQGSKTGVFVGYSWSDIDILKMRHIDQRQSFAITGYVRDTLAHRISYFLKLNGPAVVLDSACSSSLIVLDHAFKAIRSGQCDNAVVGGCALILHPGCTLQFSRYGVLSKHGPCKVFDEDADGYVRSETVACVFLQKAKNSKRIYGQIVHIKNNVDGFKPEGISYPSSQMQAQLLKEVHEECGIDPNELCFGELHGTGTKVGDIPETHAVDISTATKRKNPLWIGSVKSNMGHSEPASGIASLIKILISFENERIPPNLHFKKVKTGMTAIEEERLKVATDAIPIDKENPIISINNFGFGGSNCHVILKRVSQKKQLKDIDIPKLVCVSGRTEQSVRILLDQVKENSDDREYIGLIHQLFGKNFSTHQYRGYTVVYKNKGLKTLCELVSKQNTLSTCYINFGNIEYAFIDGIKRYFLNFPIFKNTVKIINNILLNYKDKHVEQNVQRILERLSVQLGIAETLKSLEIDSICIWEDDIGKLVCAYFDKAITIEEIIHHVVNEQIVFKNTLGLRNSKIKRYEKYLTKTSFDSCKKENSVPFNSIIIDISDSNKALLENPNIFLEIIGSLYQQGYQPQIHKLYPEIKFPVSRNTPMISPFIKWHHNKIWYDTIFTQISAEVIDNQISISLNEDKYLEGHVIDGRTLFPASGYLNIIWELIAKDRLVALELLPIVFQECKFLRATGLIKTGVANFTLCLQKSGIFELMENDSIVMTGRVSIPDNIEQVQIPFPKRDITNETEILDESDVYKELHLRGYNYSGFFKGIVKCNVEATTGLIRWENNWVSFIDKMLQMRILQLDTRLLYIPTYIKKLSIDPITHLEKIENLDSDEKLLPVYCNKECDTIKSGGIQISGLGANAISKRKARLEPVLEKNIFIANKTSLDLIKSIRVITQIILEESLESNFKALEIIDEYTKQENSPLMPLVFNALEDIVIINPDLTISTKNTIEDIPGVKIEEETLSSSSDLLFIIASNLLKRPTFLNQTLNALSPKGFALSREDKDLVPPSLEGLTILTQHTAGNEKLILFKKAVLKNDQILLKISSENFDWIKNLQKIMEKETEVILYSQDQEISGILGFFNCIRKEPGGSKIKCFYIMDEAPKFDPTNEFYKKQICKNQAVNVYKNSQWGTYRHLRLENLEKNLKEHSFIVVQTKGNFSSLKWVEGPLSSKNENIIYTYYCPLNFKDVMVASGRIKLHETQRINQENIVGLEYSGRDSRGNRVMGIVTEGALSTLISPDLDLLWPVPDHWTLKEAATVPVVYCTVTYGLLIRNSLTPGTSILINSAAGGIGIASLNVATFYKCKIFVTVGTEEKRNFIKKHFPQIPDNYIGNSRDCTFEEMIKKETKGRGVDIVVNSLSEEKLEASIRCLARGGKLIEFGKFDMINNNPLSLLFLEKEISYQGIMADILFSGTKEMKLPIYNKVLQGALDGFVKPIPTTVFKHNEVEAAFKYMATGKHIGKILIEIREEDDIKPTETSIRSLPKFFADSEKCYIILGGLGGIGLELADWLILRGARNLVLTSRNGVCTGYQTQRIKTWKSYGATIHISTINILSKKDCINLITEAKRFGDIAGVFNLAAVLEDALFEDQTSEKFSISLKPKAFATKFLDEVTRELCPNLKYFVVFSSVSCGRGNIGQTNYGMANSVMERICEKRKKDELPALAIQWGAVGDVGLVAKMQKNNKELVIGGTLQQKISSCLNVLDDLLKQNNVIVSSMVVAEKKDKNSGLGSAVEAVANILGIKDIRTISPNVSFGEMGLDSIMGAEIIQTLEKDFEIYIPPKEIRNLTFAKLITMETEKDSNNLNKNLKKAVHGANNIVQYLPNSTLAEEKITRLESKLQAKSEAKTIFVLPGVEGVFKHIEVFTRKLKAHVFGVQYSYKNPENSIREMAETILENTEPNLSKGQEFYLIAYSFGVTVALELVSLLEEKGFIGKIVVIDGSPFYSKAALLQYAPGNTDTEIETIFLCIVFPIFLPPHILSQNQEKMSKCPTLDDKINFAITLIPGEDKIEKQALITLYKRLKSVYDYKFCNQKLNSLMYLYKPEQPIIDNMKHDYQLSEFCNKKVEVSVLKGNHLTILEQDELAQNVSKIFNL